MSSQTPGVRGVFHPMKALAWQMNQDRRTAMDRRILFVLTDVSRNKKLLVTSASLLVTSALLVVTRSY